MPDGNPPEPTRRAGLARLAAFAARAGTVYAATRNEDRGPARRDNVSLLSPYLRHRLVTETEVLARVLETHGLPAARKFVDEVFWRGYFKGHLETRPSLWNEYQRGLRAELLRLDRDADLAARYRSATDGATGLDGFDAWAGELVATGYLHNHARMWFASVWIFTLGLPWQLGADFTLRHFIDGDAASNTLSWRWVAGLHTRGKHYLARASNIARYTGGRYTGAGLVEDAPALVDAVPVPPAQPLAPAVPLPAGPVALLLTEEDLHPESLPLEASRVVAVAAARDGVPRSPWPDAGAVRTFTAGALADGRVRAARHYGRDASVLEALDGDAIADWSVQAGVRTVVTAHAPVGPVQERLADARGWLRARGIELVELRRDYDTRLWPYCTRGFFELRKHIDTLLPALGIIDPADDQIGLDLPPPDAPLRTP
jgi:deoxyribodipyrimidine photo-lyase